MKYLSLLFVSLCFSFHLNAQEDDLIPFVDYATQEQIDEFFACDTEGRAGRLAQDGINIADYTPESACDWLAVFRILSREANPNLDNAILPPPEAENALRQAVSLNPLMLGHYEISRYYGFRLDPPVLIAAPDFASSPIRLIDIDYTYCFEVYCRSWYLQITPDDEAYRISGSLISTLEQVILDDEAIATMLVDNLLGAMVNLLPIPAPYGYANCRGYGYEWRVNIEYANNAHVLWTNYGTRSAGTENFALMRYNETWYWQVESYFGNALGEIIANLPELEMPQSPHAVRCDSEDLEPFYQLYRDRWID